MGRPGKEFRKLAGKLELKHAGLQSFCYQRFLFYRSQFSFNDEHGVEEVMPVIMKIAIWLQFWV